jgi:DNA-binding GntR family transcriptional regulator
MVPETVEVNNGLVDTRPLREQVYAYLRNEMHIGRLLPGEFINLSEISEKLGISKTPLRDAIIRMESHGFVTILPRRGVLVNKLTVQDVKNILGVLGALESSVIESVFDKLGPAHTDEMARINEEMTAAIRSEDTASYYQLNIAFHDVFLGLSENTIMKDIITPLKQRLYDFPRRPYIKEWELINCSEHQQLIEIIINGELQKVTALWRDSHWSFEAYEKFIRRFYFGSNKRIEAGLAWKE